MIRTILPASLAVAETTGELEETLFPDEEEAVATAIAKRRREFTSGRACARRALASLGQPRTAIPVGAGGQPRWPPGLTGSITHCAGYRGSAVGRSAAFASIGIDAEPNVPLPQAIAGRVASDAELASLRALRAATPSICWDRLLFSAKEAVFKAWFPLTRRWLAFGDAVVVLDPARATFAATIAAVPSSGSAVPHPCEFTGRWSLAHGILLTATVVARDT